MKKTVTIGALLLAAGFLSVLVYDRTEAHKKEVAAQHAAHDKEVWDGLHRCEAALQYSNTPEYRAAYQGCKDFWLPMLDRYDK